MFYLISFVLANNYCVESENRKCKDICSNYNIIFDDTFNEIPDDSSLESSSNGEIHNIYVSDNFQYKDTKHNIIICDPTNYLKYTFSYSAKPIIRVNDNIRIGNVSIKPNIHILFEFFQDMIFEIDTDGQTNFSPIIVYADRENTYFKPIYLTETIPKNLFKISSESKNIKIYEMTDNIKTMFENVDKIVEVPKTYYCVSNKQNGCQDYSSYNLIYVNETSEIKEFPNFIIIDTPIKQIYDTSYKSYYDNYAHIICLEGSDVNLFNNFVYDYFYYVIIHSNSIEFRNGLIEGPGKFTLINIDEFKLHSTTKTNNNHFTLQSYSPFDYVKTHVVSFKPDVRLELDNKINVPEYCIFHGDNSLSGLFEKEKFISHDDMILNNVTVEKLKEYDYFDLDYYFVEGNHDIPVEWKKASIFHGNNKTSFTFNDVHYFEGTFSNYYIIPSIDCLISISDFNTIIIKPSSFFFILTRSIYTYKDKVIIQVDNDFVMDGYPYDNPYYDRDEIKVSKKYFSFVGSGTVTFTSQKLMEDILYFCEVEDTVHLEVNENYKKDFYVCVGQSSLDKCKAEIKNVDSLQNKNWIWLRGMETIQFFYENAFVTDRYIMREHYYSSNVTLTANACLIILKRMIQIEKNVIDYGIYSQSSSAKIIVLVTENDNMYNNWKKQFYLYYIDEPTDFDFQIYFYYQFIKLHTYYIENYTKKSIKVNGVSNIYIREPYLPMLDIFDSNENINFVVNYDLDYSQICYSERTNQCIELDDFIMPKNYDEFVYFEKMNTYCSIYIGRNMSFLIDTYNYSHRSFTCYNNLSLTFDIPDNTLIILESNYIQIINNQTYFFQISSSQFDFTYNLKEKVTIDYSEKFIGPKSFLLTSSKSSVEIIPNSGIRKLDHIFVANNFSISSPVPQFFKGIINSTTVTQSKTWSYLYLSEKGKILYESYKAFPFRNYLNDSNLFENIVLAVGKDDVIEIPSNWSNHHNMYVLQEYNNYIVNKPSNITYYYDGCEIDNIKVLFGNLTIMPKSFVLNAYFANDQIIHKIIYNILYDCSNNFDTYLYPGVFSIKAFNWRTMELVNIYDLNSSNLLIVKLENSDNMYYLQNMIDVNNNNYLKYIYMYDYICYYPENDLSSKCSGNYFTASDSTSLLAAVRENPETPIHVGQDVMIPYLNENHFILNIKEENIKIDLPYAPTSMLISENDFIQVKYPDSSMVDILNKTTINIKLMDYFELDIESNTDSVITFQLESDVLITTKTIFSDDFTISVIKNGYHFYAEDVNQFGNIFGNSLEKMTRICAHDLNADSLCKFTDKDLIENVFQSPFLYAEVEIALSEKTKTINLPSIKHSINANILSSSASVLNINTAFDVEILSDSVITNVFWRMFGDLKVLNIILDSDSSLSIPEQFSTPISLQVMNNESSINLKSCVEQMNSKLTIHYDGNSKSEITVFGSVNNFENFKKSTLLDGNISLVLNGAQKYLCFCNDDNDCIKCSNGIDGLITNTNNILNDPGEETEIRIFSNFEMQSNLFTSENNAYIDPSVNLTLTNVLVVNQNIEEGLKVDNLIFKNVSNLLIKPKGPELDVYIRKYEQGPHFSIEIDTYLKINVPNSNEYGLSASRLYVSGHGELNLYDYPDNRIRAGPSVKVIKGVYVICGSSEGDNVCQYHSNEGYRTLKRYNRFEYGLDRDSKIVVFSSTFTNNLDADINYLSGQKIIFVSNGRSLNLLDHPIKVRFINTTELTRNSDLTTELSNSNGGALLDNTDSDLFTVGVNENLTIKQNGNISSDTNKIVIQPMSEKLTLFIDDSVDLEKQKVQIETEDEKTVSVTVLTNKNDINDEIFDNFLEKDPEKVKVTIGNENKNSPKSKGLPKGAIAGIVVAVVVIIAIIIVIIILFVKKKKKTLSNDKISEMSDSIGL